MLLAYRTVQYPQRENATASGAAKDHQIGERFHVTYLNAAGREVSITNRGHVLHLSSECTSASVKSAPQFCPGWRGPVYILSIVPTVDWALLGSGESNRAGMWQPSTAACLQDAPCLLAGIHVMIVVMLSISPLDAAPLL